MEYKIVSIVAYDRSGTTFLGNLLHFYSNVFNVGEIDRGVRKLKGERNKPCSCGAIIDECDFWSNTKNLNFGSEDINREIYDWVAKESNCGLIIDTSKSFAQIKEAQIHNSKNHLIIHIIRNPKGVIFSRLKSRKRRVINGTHPKPGIASKYNLMLIFDSFEWCWENIWLERFKKGKNNVISVFYESLEVDYDSRILPFLIEKGQLNLDKVDKESHVLSGNVNRFKINTEIRIDKEWQNGLSSFQKIMVDLITFPVRTWFKYKFVKN